MSQPKTSPTQNPGKPKKHRSFTGVFLLFFFVILLALSGSAYWVYQKQTNQSAAQFKQLESKLAQANTQVSVLAQQQQRFDQQLATNDKVLTHLSKQLNRNDARWLVADALHLTRLAVYTLDITHNASTARALLNAANVQVTSLSDATLMPVRKALAQGIAELNAAPKVDTVGIVTQLGALNHIVPKLEFIAQVRQKVDTKTKKETVQATGWRAHLEAAWQSILTIISVQRLKGPNNILLTPAQHISVQQQINSLLVQAQWAVLHRNTSIYQTSLKQAAQLAERYFNKKNMATQSFLASIEQLQHVNISPDLPDLTSVLQTVHQFARNNQSAPGVQ